RETGHYWIKVNDGRGYEQIGHWSALDRTWTFVGEHRRYTVNDIERDMEILAAVPFWTELARDDRAWWITELTKLWNEGTVTPNTRQAARIALDALALVQEAMTDLTAMAAPARHQGDSAPP
ncbi:MAG TPA: hypothetical protein VHK68_04060, partial [Gemmatimonadales bacterium]|nr:hypothetical protein [Gemmatimonadales bacterium]